MIRAHQGEILSVNNIKTPVLVVSKDFFNESGQIIACPVIKNAPTDALHIEINAGELNGVVLCEQIKLIDINARGCRKIDKIDIGDIMNIADAIQSIFDYYPYDRLS